MKDDFILETAEFMAAMSSTLTLECLRVESLQAIVHNECTCIYFLYTVCLFFGVIVH